MITGEHYIAGTWISGSETFQSRPYSGAPRTFFCGSDELVDESVMQAERAFTKFGWSSRQERADFLNEIATQIDALGNEITEIAMEETGLPEARLIGERGRTVGQLRLFASHILAGDYLDERHDHALPNRAPLPRPDLRMIQRPVGPVAVFGASNFPLAFSVAGGDTASALAAGCPVVVKGHPAHPGTSEIVARAIDAAIKSTGIPNGVFSLIQDSGIEVGTALAQHPLIEAVGFTGSLRAGRALFDLCSARPKPVPFFGELGSINPMFLLPSATSKRAAEIGSAWAGSLSMGAGQFCTNPGVALVVEGAGADRFIAAARTALGKVAPQTMLTDGIADAFRSGVQRVSDIPGVKKIFGEEADARSAIPHLMQTTGADWLTIPSLHEEVFGPLGVIVIVTGVEQMREVAQGLEGQLTATLHMEDDDMEDAASLVPILERKAGRLLVNGFPTGVEVCDSMVHSGPYPASTNFGATSVGTLAIRRFLRPVCYQNFPEELLITT